MKKIILFTCSVILLVACTQKPEYQISGSVAESSLNGKYVYLYSLDENAVQPLDSALVDNGIFLMKGVQEVPALRRLSFSSDVIKPSRVPAGQNNPFSVVFTLENAKLNVVLDSISTVTGTPENDALAALQKEVQLINKDMSALYADMRSTDDTIVANAEKKYEDLSDKLSSVVKTYLLNNVDKLSAGKLLYDFRYNLSEADQNEIVAQADSVFKSAPGVDRLIAHLDVLKNVSVGKKFIDFEMADTKGNIKKLSDYVGQGKYVLIDFWASWCPPCRKEMPNLVAAYKQYKKKGFEIVGVSLDSEKENWEKGIQDLNITWPQLSDLQGWKNAGAALYGVNSIPHVVLTDKDGVIIAKNLRGEELDKKLKELFK